MWVCSNRYGTVLCTIQYIYKFLAERKVGLGIFPGRSINLTADHFPFVITISGVRSYGSKTRTNKKWPFACSPSSFYYIFTKNQKERKVSYLAYLSIPHHFSFVNWTLQWPINLILSLIIEDTMDYLGFHSRHLYYS